MPASDVAANAALDNELQAAGEIGLLLTLPAADGTGYVEPPTAAGYARVATTAGAWTVAAARESTLTPEVTFPAATGDWGTVRGWGWFRGGQLRVWEPLAQAVNVLTGATEGFAAAVLKVRA